MKSKRLFLGAVLALIFAPISNTFASVQDFYFEDFTGDYYLSKDDEGISYLKVVESVTAVFPDYKQNKGICRQIAYTNQNGANITLPMGIIVCALGRMNMCWEHKYMDLSMNLIRW